MSDVVARLAPAMAGRYTIIRELGQGGMAVVYLAEDARHHRRVAIKVFSPELSAMLGQERFLKEIALTASLQHPHILPLFDSGSADGLLYYVMPFVEGETLRSRLTRERQLPVAEAVQLAREVADALEYAHRHGVIHRDIKPENVLLHEGRALVADFGIALAVREAGGTRLTHTGMSLGTPQYMAPEQAMGDKAIDARADVYALGVLLYEMLAGEPPFTGPTAQAIVAKVMTTDPVPVSELRRSVPGHVGAAVTAAIQKVPADRPAGAAAFAVLLAGSGGAVPVAVPAGRTPWRRHPAVAGFAGAMLTALAALALKQGAPRTPDPLATGPVRFQLTPPDSVELQAVCCGRMMVFSPDGRTFVFQARPRTTAAGAPPAEYLLYARDMSDLAVRPLAGTDGATSLSFSPDGRQLAYVVRQRLFRIGMDGTVPVPVASLPPGFIGGTSWMSMDTIIVAVGSTLQAVGVAGGGLRELLAPDSNARQPTGPHWVAEGDGLLFSYAALDQSPEVHWLARGSTLPRRVATGATPTWVPAWRRLVILQGASLMSFPFDPATGDTSGSAVQLATGVVARSPVFAHGEFAIAPQGLLAMARRASGTSTGTLQLHREGFDTVVSVGARGAYGGRVRFAPDGRRLSVSVGDVAVEQGDQSRVIYTWDLERRVSQRVSSIPGARESQWVAGGDSIVYLVLESGQLVLQAADGSGTPRELPRLTGWHAVRQLSLQGKWVAVGGSSQAGRASDIGYVHLDTLGAVRPLVATAAEEGDPELSPDSKWIAYASDETGESEVYVSAFPSGAARFRVSTGGGRLPRWSPDTRTLYYAGAQAFHAVAFGTAGGKPVLGTPRVIFRRPFVRSWDVSPDGRWLAFIDTVRLLELLGIEFVIGLGASPP